MVLSEGEKKSNGDIWVSIVQVTLFDSGVDGFTRGVGRGGD